MTSQISAQGDSNNINWIICVQCLKEIDVDEHVDIVKSSIVLIAAKIAAKKN